VRVGFGESAYWSVQTDMMALAAFTVTFILLATFFHYKTRDRS